MRLSSYWLFENLMGLYFFETLLNKDFLVYVFD